MSRLIELQQPMDCRGPLRIRVGDVVLISASGGRIESGSSIELGGPYLPATAVASGEVLTAMGTPHSMLAWARHRGPAVVELVIGDSWHEAQATLVHITVEE